MKKIFFLFILTFAVSNLFSQDENYDAVYKKLTKVYTLNADGSMDYRYSKELKLQTYRSFNSLYGETFIVYNPAYQQLKVNQVQTTMSDGKKVTAPSNAFNEVLPSFAAGAPAFNGLREMVVTHPGTERNAVLVIDYNVHTSKGIFQFMSGVEIMTESEPVKDLTLKIRVPAGTKLSYKPVNTNAAPVISQEEGFQVYTWNMKDVPAFSTEENQKGWNESYPRIIFSTAKDRQSVYTAFLDQPAFSFTADDAVKKVVSGVMEENKQPVDIILKLQEKVVNDVKTWPVPLQFTAYKCRSAAEVLKSNGGTVAEKAILLATMLRNAGIEAEVAGVIRNSLYDESVGTMQDIEDFVVFATPKEIEPMYLSVTKLNTQTLKYGLPGKTLVMLSPGKKTAAVKMDEYKSKVKLASRFVINDKSQLEGEVSGTFDYNFNQWLTQLRDKVKMKSYFTGGIASSDLKEVKVVTTGPVEGFVTYTAVKDKPFKKDSSFYFYTLPAVTNGIDSWGMKLLPVSRTTVMEIPSEAEENYEFILDAGTMTLFSTGKDASVKNSAGTFTYEAKQDGSKIIIKKSIVLAKRMITPEDYAGFRELMNRWNANSTREIILR